MPVAYGEGEERDTVGFTHGLLFGYIELLDLRSFEQGDDGIYAGGFQRAYLVFEPIAAPRTRHDAEPPGFNAFNPIDLHLHLIARRRASSARRPLRSNLT